MKREAIVKAASEMKTPHDLLVLLNRIKMDELGQKGHPFTMPQLNYFINPKRSAGHYRTFTIPKRSGGVRTISAPRLMLKSFQRYTGHLLQAFYEAPEYVTGFVPARSVVDNAERHVGMRYVFNTDLKDFFPSISQARVWGALQTRPFNFPKTIASAIAGLCCIQKEIPRETDPDMMDEFGTPTPQYRYVLPQGSPCSPVLTNIVCHNLDWKLSGLARRFHLRYSRYADDITFSGNEDIFHEDGEFMREFRRIIADQNFQLNEKKTRVQKRGARQEVTGLVVSEQRVNVPREFIRDLDNLLFIWERDGKNAAFAKFISRYTPKQDNGYGFPIMESVVQGRLQYLRMVRGEVDPTWKRLQKRFNRLMDRPESSCGTDFEYLHDYTIKRFEALTGASVVFTPNDGFVSVSVTLGGREYLVQTSRYVRTRLTHILGSASPEKELEAFRTKYHIAYCHRSGTVENGRFWFIFRYPPSC